MIEPYQVVGLIQTVRGTRRREEISVNLEHIEELVRGLVAVGHGPAGPAAVHP